MNDGNKNYSDRQKIKNLGEELFEMYCKKNGYDFHRTGFDEKRNNIPNFYRLNILLRNTPDYILNTEESTYVVNVKGTANFKQSEISLLPLFLEWYSSKKAPLVYCFCFEGYEKPFILYPEQIIDKYEKEVDKKWNDGVVYRTLNFE